MRLVYVAGPFSAPTREGVEVNIARATEVGIELAELGVMPVVPHSNTADPRYEKLQPYAWWIVATLELLRRCDAIFMVPGWEKSSGARGERDEMIRLRRPVFDDLQQVAIWRLDQ